MTRLLLLLALLWSFPAVAQTFPALTGRVVDNADLLPPDQEAALTAKLEALERGSGRQFVVATVPSLEGRPIEDYGYRLGRHWAIGSADKDDGTILLVAPNERKVRIETGYGIRPVLTDAVSSVIIRNSILPAFKAGDFARGINEGADQIINMLQLPQAEGEARARAIGEQQAARSENSGGSIFPLIFWIIVLFFVIIPMFRRRRYGRKYGRRRGGGFPIVIWGPGMGGGGWGGGGGGFGGGGGGFGGFSGGGGSFGGGGASGGW